MARRLGGRDAWIAAVRAEVPEEERNVVGSIEDMEPAWRAALQYAEQMTDSGHAVTDEVYTQLSTAWSEEEIVEISLVAGLFNYFNRFNDALAVEVTR